MDGREMKCPTPCATCDTIVELHRMIRVGGVWTDMVCEDCYAEIIESQEREFESDGISDY